MQELELALQGEDSNRPPHLGCIQELDQLVLGVRLLGEIAIDRIKQDNVQAAGLKCWSVTNDRRWQLRLGRGRGLRDGMLKSKPADLLRLAIFEQRKIFSL